MHGILKIKKKTLDKPRDKLVGASQIDYHRKTWDTLVSRSTRGLATAVIDGMRDGEL